MPLVEIYAILCIVSFFVLLAIGLPVALTLAISGLFWGYLGFGAGLFDLLPARIYGVTANYTLIAIPLFVFMGVMLEKSKIADDLMDVIGHLAGGLRGGMGIGIILVGVLMGLNFGAVQFNRSSSIRRAAPRAGSGRAISGRPSSCCTPPRRTSP